MKRVLMCCVSVVLLVSGLLSGCGMDSLIECRMVEPAHPSQICLLTGEEGLDPEHPVPEYI